MQNVFPISDGIFLQPGPHPIELKQIPTENYPDSSTLSKKRPAQIFKPYDLPNTPPLYNDPGKNQVNAVAQEPKQMALHAHCEVQKQTSACIVYEKVHEEATAEYLQHTAEIEETV